MHFTFLDEKIAQQFFDRNISNMILSHKSVINIHEDIPHKKNAKERYK